MSRINSWSAVISNPAFWADYYVSRIIFLEEEDDFELVEAIFGCDRETLADFDRALLGFDWTMSKVDAEPEETEFARWNAFLARVLQESGGWGG